MQIFQGLLYAATLGLSAFLLFAIQPFAGKALLPALGGVPAVWIGCVLFFQIALLAGYSYAALLSQKLRPAYALLVHTAMILFSLLCSTLTVGAIQNSFSASSPLLRILLTLSVTIGPPIFICASTSPLIQAWFSRHSKRPYILYVASNLGSFAALLAYPLVIEPRYGLEQQIGNWSQLYSILALVILCCGIISLLRSSPLQNMPAVVPSEATPKTVITLHQRLSWVLISFFPSAIMLAMTLHITTNVVAFPLLWVLPLALYLLSFTIAFLDIPLSSAKLYRLMVLLLVSLSPLFFYEVRQTIFATILCHLALMFIIALYCHRLLYEQRPSADKLTSFYLWLSFGGVMGGIFMGLLAPLLFSAVIEYPLLCALVPILGVSTWHKALAPRVIIPAIIFLAVAWGLQRADSLQFLVIIYGITALICFSFIKIRAHFAVSFFLLIMGFFWFTEHESHSVVSRARNFFGPKKIVIDPQEGIKSLYHGTVVHGCESLSKDRPLAQCYYHPLGPMGDIFKARDEAGTFAVIGLGIGSSSCYAKADEKIIFFEIDPLIEKLAREQFSILDSCGRSASVIIGDGRLRVSELPAHSLSLLIVDAFSSDSIPTHLVTQEAIQLYKNQLSKNGALLFHISNNYLDLSPLLGELGRATGFTVIEKQDDPAEDAPVAERRFSSHYLLMSSNAELVTKLTRDYKWIPVTRKYQGQVWTDDFSEMTGILGGTIAKLFH